MGVLAGSTQIGPNEVVRSVHSMIGARGVAVEAESADTGTAAASFPVVLTSGK
jgi:hypothetical protein